jgi:transposase
MCDPIMIACDLHDKTMVLLWAQGRSAARKLTLPNTLAGQEKLLVMLRDHSRQAAGARVIFAYEASSLGFGLHDALRDAGFECFVLAPTRIPRSAEQRRRKTDHKDAEQILDLLRAHVLAGVALPAVWIPDSQTRDDREVVRARLDLAQKSAALKAQVQSLLKRNHRRRPAGLGKGWTKAFWAWLRGLANGPGLGQGTRDTLSSLLRQLEFFVEELERVDEQLLRLVNHPRYAVALQKMAALPGVGALTALVFLTEIGDLSRFSNRRQISAYLGLVPSCRESGSRNDCKGHITRQGSVHVRRVLCQASWSRIRAEGADEEAYRRLVQKNPKHKKIAVVAVMRRLAIRMWHRGAGHEPPVSRHPASELRHPEADPKLSAPGLATGTPVGGWLEHVRLICRGN